MYHRRRHRPYLLWPLGGIFVASIIAGMTFLSAAWDTADEESGVIRQGDTNDCAPAAVTMVLRSRGLDAPYADVAAAFDLSEGGASVRQVVDVLERFGVAAQAWRTTKGALDSLAGPVILFVDASHFIVLDSVDSGTLHVRDPAAGRIALEQMELERRWEGVVIMAPPGRTTP